MQTIYLSDIEESMRGDLEKEIVRVRPDLAEAIENGDTIILGEFDLATVTLG